MFVVSMKTTRPRVILTVAVVALLLVTMLVLSGKQEAAATGAPVSAADDSGRRAFLRQLGYELGDDQAQVREILVPAEFDEAFSAYNLLQLDTGYDLALYRGKRVKCWTYSVTNYPGKDPVQAHLYVYKDTIIGGDVSSTLQDGFCHGLKALTTGES